MSHNPIAPLPAYRPLSVEEVRAAAGAARADWLWRGYLVPGGITLLTSLWKAGKTTLLSVLLHRMKTGGLLAGEPLAAGRAVIVSEEDPTLWERRSRSLDFGGHVSFLCRPFRGKPTPAEWRALIDSLAALRREGGVDLAVIDPLAAFVPGRDENTAGMMLEALLPLQSLTAAGMAVLLLHHPRRQSSAPGQMARGSGALSGHVEVILEMTTLSAEPGDRRRRLQGFSRFAETPADRVIELNAEGTDYVSLGDMAEQEFIRGWPQLRLVLTGARDKLTRREIVAEWPPDQERPSDTTLWRWLERAADRNLLRREGAGHSKEPFRYWLAEKEAVWRDDPIWVLLQQQREAMKGLGCLPEQD
jgi:hypothetical protein